VKQGKTQEAFAKYDEALRYAPNWKPLKAARESLANRQALSRVPKRSSKCRATGGFPRVSPQALMR
jgi:hypothetical protein